MRVAFATTSSLCVQPHAQRESVVRESFNLVSKRPDTVCNFLEGTEVTHEIRQIDART